MSASSPAPRPEPKDALMHRVMTRVSIMASIAAGLFMLLGFVLFLLSPMKIPGKSELHRLPAPTISQLFTGSAYKSPSTYLGLGLIVLALTPILRILVALEY